VELEVLVEDSMETEDSMGCSMASCSKADTGMGCTVVYWDTLCTVAVGACLVLGVVATWS